MSKLALHVFRLVHAAQRIPVGEYRDLPAARVLELFAETDASELPNLAGWFARRLPGVTVSVQGDKVTFRRDVSEVQAVCGATRNA